MDDDLNSNSASPGSISLTSKSRKKRNRVPLSCTICRKRKVKCDKNRPHCKQCTKSGVGRLCHYMEQTWAEEAEKELSKEAELKQLRERVKSLEETLTKIHSNNTPSVVNSEEDESSIDKEPKHIDYKSLGVAGVANLAQISLFDKYDKDELDLTKNFDMLHFKNNGTIHLGATHWLAIMKGDPYLKLLWGHIFTMREKLNEWYVKKKNSPTLQQSSKCPIIHNSNSSEDITGDANSIDILGSAAKCPVAGIDESVTMRKCPIAHNDITTATTGFVENKCPVIHENLASDMPNSGQDKCPVMHKKAMNLVPSVNDTKHSVVHKNFTKDIPSTSEGKCPVIHEGIMRSTLDDGPNNFHAGDSVQFKNSHKLNEFHADSTNLTDKKARKCPIDHEKFMKSVNSENLKADSVFNGKFPRKNIRSPLELTDDTVKIETDFSKKSIDEFLPLNESEVIYKVATLLPPQEIISLFLDEFFKHIYPTIPILDEQIFRKRINLLLVYESDVSSNRKLAEPNSERLTLNLIKSTDFCNFGILLIILRLTWLSLPSNSCKIRLDKECISLISQSTTASEFQAKKEALLLEHEPSNLAIELVKRYLIKLDEVTSISNNNVSLTTVHYAIFYQRYLMCCLDTDAISTMTSVSKFSASGGQDNESHQVLLSSIIQMAFSCGLHRDPDNFPQLNKVAANAAESSASFPSDNDDGKGSKNDISNIERFKHVWRKTWFFIVSLDVQQSLSLGAPRLLRNLKDFSDTKLPSASKIDYVSDIKELVIVKNFTLFFQIDLVIISVLNHVLNVSISRSVRKFELDSLITILEDLTHGNKRICEVLNELVNKGLLYAVEGKVEQSLYEDYQLSTLESILDQGNSSQLDGDMDKKLDISYESTTKALFFSKHMTIRMLLYLLNYILFTHYEPLGNKEPETSVLAKKYAQQTLKYSMDGFESCVLFFTSLSHRKNTISLFDYMGMVLAPSCLDIGNRAMQFLVCLILRAKCGPLNGMGESILGNSSTVSSSEEDSERGLINDDSSSSAISSKMIFEDMDISVGSKLADVLSRRMLKFYKLTEQLSSKYSYAARLKRSTGFFIALLGFSDDSKSKLSYNGKSKMSSFFRNVPSFVLTGDKESLKRCPVYQDAMGFVETKANMPNGLIKAMKNGHHEQITNNMTQQISSYEPVTYGIKHKDATDKDNFESKRKKAKLSTKLHNLTGKPHKVTPTLQQMTPNEFGDAVDQFGKEQETQKKMTVEPNQISNFDSNEKPSTKTENIYSKSNSSVVPMTSPNSQNSADNENHLATELQSFLMENSNFNGFMIDPSSFVEAVGLDLSKDVSMNFESNDLLSFENAAFDALPDLGNTEYSIWE